MTRKAIKDAAGYCRALSAWAHATASRPVNSWNGPGAYRETGFYDDEGRPCATLEKT